MAKKNQEAKLNEESASEPSIDFDSWWATVENKIPRHHHKEIVRADMLARGLSLSETSANFNEGLKAYGVKLS